MSTKAPALRTSAQWHHAAALSCALGQDSLFVTGLGLGYTEASIRQPKSQNPEADT